MGYLIAVIVSFAFAVVADVLDSYYTNKGIKAGVAVEGNSYIVALAGTDKPSFLKVLLISMLIPILPVGILGLIVGYGSPAAIVFSTMLVLTGIKHVNGARAWVNLLNGGKPDNGSKTAWQKFWEG